MKNKYSVIIAGSRDLGSVSKRGEAQAQMDLDFVFATLDSFFFRKEPRHYEIVSGGARGAETLGEQWADDKGYDVHLFVPNYDYKPKYAPKRRNREMGDYSDELVAFWDGESNGTRHMINVMMERKKPIHIYFFGKSFEKMI